MTEDQRSASPGFSFTWVIAASAVHLLLWFVLVGYFVVYVPHQKQVFSDFGVALPQAAILVISLSDLILQAWYLLVPLLFVLVVGVNVAIVAVVRRRGWRIVLLAFLTLSPLGWLVTCHLILSIPLNNLIQGLQ